MIGDRIKEITDYQTCLCCLCRCGEHDCYPQLALKIPPSLKFADTDPLRRNALKTCTHKGAFRSPDLMTRVNRQKTEAFRQSLLGDREKTEPFRVRDPVARFLDPVDRVWTEADLYRKTMYRKDFCEQKDIIDRFPLEQSRLNGSIKMNSTQGYDCNDSTYKNDFIPWSLEDQNLCRAKLHVPDYMLRKGGSGDAPRLNESDLLHSYYCPPHCIGDSKREAKENCLVGHKDHFNLGPPSPRRTFDFEKPAEPFAKFSSYMLDYKGSKIPPKKRFVPRITDITMNPGKPMSSETSYRNAFATAPSIHNKPVKEKGQADSLTTGDGPMQAQSTSMQDYKDPDVGIHQPTRPPKGVYHPPECRMEMSTTTDSTFRKWEDFPRQEILKKHRDEGSYALGDTENRYLFTTYQEDFDGLRSALCPGRLVDRYGPKKLEPRYNFIESDNQHDMFRFKAKHMDRKKVCFH